MTENEMADKILVCFKRSCPQQDKIITAIDIANILRTLHHVEKSMFENVIKEMISTGMMYIGKSGIGDCLILTEKGRIITNQRNSISLKSQEAEVAAGDFTVPPTLSGINQHNEMGQNYSAG